MAKVFNSDAGKMSWPAIFRPTAPSPIDERTVVEFVDDLITQDVWMVNNTETRYEGLTVYVKQDQKLYVLINAEYKNEMKGWVAVGTGTGGGSLNPDDLSGITSALTAIKESLKEKIDTEDVNSAITAINEDYNAMSSAITALDEAIAAIEKNYVAKVDTHDTDLSITTSGTTTYIDMVGFHGGTI